MYAKHMRTTLVLNDDLARKAKQKALEGGTTLSELTNRALREYLLNSSASEREPKRRVSLPSYRGPGPVVDLTPAQIAELRDLDS